MVRRFVENRNWQDIIATLKASKLRGMGGAGFPTGLKWEIVRNAPGSTKYIVCNADESEPGTIKDRHIMENVPYLVIEGMIIAGLVTGAQQGNSLYPARIRSARKRFLQEEIERCYQHGHSRTAKYWAAIWPSIWRFLSAPAAISAEKRARCSKPSKASAPSRATSLRFPVTNGLWNQPTVINNVETFCAGHRDPGARAGVVSNRKARTALSA